MLPLLNNKKLTKFLIDFIQNQLKISGFNKLIIGLSGGLDSTVVAYLVANSISSQNIFGFFLPYGNLHTESYKYVKLIAKSLKINIQTIDITAQIDIYFNSQIILELDSRSPIGVEDKLRGNDKKKYNNILFEKLERSGWIKNDEINVLRKGNKMARERMSILFDQAKKYNALVIGTSNKTESLLGYGTWFGDTAWSFNPIGYLYKTQVRELAKYLIIPSEIINRPPSADLWLGQTDEGEIGYSYKNLDEFLYNYIDLRKNETQLLKLGFSKKMIKDLILRINQNKFKSQIPPIAKIRNKDQPCL